MLDVLALAAMLGAVARPALCPPRTTRATSVASPTSTGATGRRLPRSAPVVELATLTRRSRAAAVREGISQLRALLNRVARNARRLRPAVPVLLPDVRPAPCPWSDATPAGSTRCPDLGHRPTVGVLRAPGGGRIMLDDGRDLDLRFSSILRAPAGVVRTGDHMDAMRVTGPDGRIHVPAEEHGRVAFDLTPGAE